jgi:hypothetical protein
MRRRLIVDPTRRGPADFPDRSKGAGNAVDGAGPGGAGKLRTSLKPSIDHNLLT